MNITKTLMAIGITSAMMMPFTACQQAQRENPLLQESGLPYGRLLDEMVDCAMRAYREKERNSFAFASDILSGVALGGKAGGKMGGKVKL